MSLLNERSASPPSAAGVVTGPPCSSTNDDSAGPTFVPMWVAMCGCAVVLSLLLTEAWEWGHYRRVVQWELLHATALDRLTIYWTLWSKSILLQIPVIIAAEVAARCLGRRTGWIVWLLGATACLGWLVVDLRVQHVTGNHITTYLEFADDPGAWQWSGGVSGILLMAMAIVACVAAVVATTSTLIYRLLKWTGCGDGPRRKRLIGGTAAALLALSIVGPIPLESSVTEALALERLHSLLPLDPHGFRGSDTTTSNVELFRIALNRQLATDFKILRSALTNVPPSDAVAQLREPARRNVIVLVFESFRHDVVTPDAMPNLHAASRNGLVFARHHSGSNASQYGLFCLLYGRSPLLYDATLDAGVPPQFCVTFRNSGYAATYISSSPIPWIRMEEFINERTFDRLIVEDNGDWPGDDSAVLAHVLRESRRDDRPQLIVAFLMSTHYPYLYPPRWERRTPVMPPEQVIQATPADRELLRNRYFNTTNFLDEELGRLFQSLDLSRNLVIVTGDHGEALFDDGTLAHNSRLSEIQTRVPLVMFGASIEPGVIRTATTHADVLPTVLHALNRRPIEVAHCQGRSLLGGPQPDEAFLCTTEDGGNLWKALVIRGRERLNLQMPRALTDVRAVGFLDAVGGLDTQQAPQVEEAEAWSETVRRHWERIAH
jgi:hypothetical protein